MDYLFRNILDLSIDIKNTIKIIMDKWKYDPVPQGIDFISFIFSIVDSQPEIKINKFQNNVKLINVIGNNNNFSLSIRLLDNEKIYCFKLTDPEGCLLINLSDIIFNKYPIHFNKFMKDNKWLDFYSDNYIMTKCLIDRLKNESSYYFENIKAMLAEGIKYPTEKENQFDIPIKEKIKKKITVLTSEVIHPGFVSDFPKIAFNQNNLIDITNKRNKFIYSIIPRLNFIIRPIEYDFLKYSQGPEIDITDPIWDYRFRLRRDNLKWTKNKIKRTEWDELSLQEGFILRKRIHERTD